MKTDACTGTVPKPRRPGAEFLRFTLLLSVAAACLRIGSLSQAETKVRVGTERGYPGNVVRVPFSLHGSTNVTALQADIFFDGGRITSAPPLPGSTLGHHTLLSSEPSPGVRRLLLYSRNNAPLIDGSPAGLLFTVSPTTTSGLVELAVTNVVLSRADAAFESSAIFSGYIVISPVFRRPDGTIDFFLTVVPGPDYVIQASTNLTDWVNISTNSASSSLLRSLDLEAVQFPYRFYRAVAPSP